jgi:hypothetical protein
MTSVLHRHHVASDKPHWRKFKVSQSRGALFSSPFTLLTLALPAPSAALESFLTFLTACKIHFSHFGNYSEKR